MQVNIYIQDQLYKTVDVAGDSYNLGEIFAIIDVDKSQGLLESFDQTRSLDVKLVPVYN